MEYMVWNENHLTCGMRLYLGLLLFSSSTGLPSFLIRFKQCAIVVSFFVEIMMFCFAHHLIFVPVGFLTLFIGFASCAHIKFKRLLLSRSN